jgi:hypothetical protein
LASKSFLTPLCRYASLNGIFARLEQKFGRQPPQINALYRWQYSLGADFAKNATITRLRKS